MEDNNKNIQGLLGFSSKEKILYVVYSDDNETIYVYMGLTLMWTIPNDHNFFIFKSTIVAIAKAGIRIKDIEDAFNISFKTIKKYLNSVTIS